MNTTHIIDRLLPALLLAAAACGVSAAEPQVPAQMHGSLRITPKMIHEAAQFSPERGGGGQSSVRLLREEVQPYDIFKKPAQNLDDIPNACKAGSGSLCYDYRSGRTVYKPMRKLLPEIPGLTPHNISVRRGRVIAQYTFK